MKDRVQWIAADWGTSRLRLWAMDDGGEAVAERALDRGMATLAPDEFEAVLLQAAGDWLDARSRRAVIACGMVGARQGWSEAAYRAVPAAPLGAGGFTRAPVRDGRIAVWIVPGLSQDSPADVLRGEETQVAGFLAGEPDFAGTVCLPGTHSKWVRIADGRVTGFRTAMTGELFALLRERSILRHSLEGAGDDGAASAAAVDPAAVDPAAVDPEAFRAALAAAGDVLAELPLSLFSIRAGDLLHAVPPAQARARLSALLIAAEVGAARAGSAGGEIVLLGAASLAGLYEEAIRAAGGTARRVDATAATLAGLRAARALIGENGDD